VEVALPGASALEFSRSSCRVLSVTRSSDGGPVGGPLATTTARIGLVVTVAVHDGIHDSSGHRFDNHGERAAVAPHLPGGAGDPAASSSAPQGSF
jgi:hypothetical protein